VTILRRPDLTTGSSAPWLVSHGSEHTTLGGPTTRLLQIERTVKASGRDIISSPRVADALRTDTPPALVHVFNCWALKSALTTLGLARRTGAPVVFSPIMLNLADRAFYDFGIKALLRQATTDAQIVDGAAMIRELTPVWDPKTGTAPRQGETSHFDMLRRQTMLADHLICLSAYEQALLGVIGVGGETTIVQNGVDTETMAAGDRQAFVQAFGLSDFVLMVGRIEPRKNQALAAFALRDLDVPLVCIGHVGDADYFAQLKRWAGPRLIHIDRITDRAVLAGAYKAASALVLPSWSEGAPLVALEAAAAGTPLILSDMSSEREYFGDWADYVHPCDLHGMKRLVQQQLDTPDSDARRAERSAMACERFSIERHARNTLAVYDKVLATASARKARNAAAPVILDTTHLAHQINSRSPLTGVPAVELELGKALLAAEPTARVVAWSSRARRHFPVPAEAFGDEAMGPFADMAAPAPEAFDLTCEPAEIRISPTRGTTRKMHERSPGIARRALTLFKHALNGLPGGLHRGAVGILRRAKPAFSPIVLPEHHLLQSARTGPQRTRTSDASAGQVRLSVSLRPQARQTFPELPRGARLIVLGHAWISNDRYLDDLAECVARYDLKLWVHVPDILYVTRPDTFDAETSATFAGRLLRILEIADTVITISAQSEAEIRAFAESHGLNRAIRRIILGTPQLDTDSKSAPQQTEILSPYALYVASMSERKRHDFLIDAWRAARARSAAARGARLILVGRPLGGFERFADAAHQARLAEDGITVINGCSADHLARLYRHAAFTVYPSAAEGWGLPPVESLLMGKPCLISDSLPVAQEIDSAGLKRVPTLSPDAWTEALCEWLDSTEALKAASDQARDFEPPAWAAAADVLLTA
jgi:glycosyltransferase involved in cell wall biosynthesis